jgi:hypothetical protein
MLVSKEMKEKGTRETENSSTGRNKRAGLAIDLTNRVSTPACGFVIGGKITVRVRR